MAQTSVRQTIPLPAERVWSLVGDLRTGDRWPAVLASEIAGEGVGCIRSLHLVDGNLIRERLEARDDAERLRRLGGARVLEAAAARAPLHRDGARARPA